MDDTSSQPSPDAPSADDAARLVRAKEIFLAVLELGVSARDEVIDRMCGADIVLRDQVRALIRGAEAPLPFETLADDIKAAHRTRIGVPGTLDTSSLGASAGSAGSDRIGNYRLLERIGEGGFGIVYMAEQEKPVRRRVALKIIKLGMDTKQVVARFEAERQALALMDHASIAKVFDAGATATGRPYFVMELVRGLSITEYCDQRKLSIRERLGLIAQVCDALQHAHSKGVIHRDIKPSNVMVSTIGDTPAPKIIDFGIAKATSARLTEKTIFTEFRQMIGTPEYMSPEQAGESGEDVDTRTDVYSVGVLLYELLTGSTPFDSKRLRSAAFGEMQRIIREEDPPAPSTKVTANAESLFAVAEKRATAPTRLPTLIRGELDWIVMKALEKDRSRRYSTAAAMAADLNRYLSGHAVEAAPPGAAYRVRKFVRRHKGAVGAAALVALVLIAGLIGTTLGFFRAETQRKQAVGQRMRADEKTIEAEASEAIAMRRAYTASMLSACEAINTMRFSTARSFLDAAPERLRGWEWSVLHEKLDSSMRFITVPAPGTQVQHLLAYPDGRSLLAVSPGNDTLVRRWSIDDGGLLQTFPAAFQRGPSECSIAVLSPDGRRVMTSARNLLANAPSLPVEQWDTVTGKRTLRVELPSPPGEQFYVQPNSQGTRVLMFGGDRVRLTDVATSRILAEQPLDALRIPLAFSRDDSLIAEYFPLPPSTTFALRDGRTLTPLDTLSGHTGYIADAEFSNDARWLGSAADDDTARIWDLSAHPPTSVVLRHPFGVGAIRFSPDAGLVATVARDSAIRIWDRATGNMLATYARGETSGSAFTFLPDGRTIAAWDAADNTVRFWDVTAESTCALRGHVSTVSKARFAATNPAGIIVSASWDGIEGATGLVRLWDADSGDEVGVYQGVTDDIAFALAISGDDRLAAIGFSNARIYQTSDPQNRVRGRTEILDLATGKQICSNKTSGQPFWAAFGPDDASVIVAERPASSVTPIRLRALDTRSGAEIASRQLDPKCVWVFASTSDGRTIAALPAMGSEDQRPDRPGTMLLIDSRTLETVREIDGIPEDQRSMGFSADGRFIAMGSVEGAVTIVDVQTGAVRATMLGHGMEVLTVAFSPDGKRLASAGLDRQVRIWDTTTYDQVAAFGGHQGHIGDLDWDPAGVRLISCSGDSTIRFWEPAPIRTRVEAREARRAALAIVESMVAKWFAELGDAEKVIERINTETSLTPHQRKTALQVVLRTGLERQE